jgi:hypothetical protein
MGADAGFLEMVASLKANRSANEKGEQQSKREVYVLYHAKLSEVESS